MGVQAAGKGQKQNAAPLIPSAMHVASIHTCCSTVSSCIVHYLYQCLSRFSRETVNRICIYHDHMCIWLMYTQSVYIQFIIRSWLIWLWRRRSHRICSWQAGGLGELMSQLKLSGLRSSFLPGPFVLFKPSMDRMRPTYTGESSLLSFTQSINSNGNLI